jgi:SET domain-containing protein
MPIGVVAFVNHSDNPNADMLRDPLKQVVQLVACVEIQEGVEVTVDYGHPFRCVGCGARG